MFYGRYNLRVFFMLPAVAIGVDTDGRFFCEVVWGCWAVGVGDKP